MSKFLDFFIKNKKILLVLIVVITLLGIFTKFLFKSQFADTGVPPNNYLTTDNKPPLIPFVFPDPTINKTGLSIIDPVRPSQVGSTGYSTLTGTVEVLDSSVSLGLIEDPGIITGVDENDLLQLFLRQPKYADFMFNTSPVTPLGFTFDINGIANGIDTSVTITSLLKSLFINKTDDIVYDDLWNNKKITIKADGSISENQNGTINSLTKISLAQAIAIPYDPTTTQLNPFRIARTNLIAAVLDGISYLYGNAPPTIEGDTFKGLIGDLYNIYIFNTQNTEYRSTTTVTNGIKYTPNVKNAVWAYLIARMTEISRLRKNDTLLGL